MFHSSIVLKLNSFQQSLVSCQNLPIFELRNTLGFQLLRVTEIVHLYWLWRSGVVWLEWGNVQKLLFFLTWKVSVIHCNVVIKIRSLFALSMGSPFKSWVEWSKEINPLFTDSLSFFFKLFFVKEKTLWWNFDLFLGKLLIFLNVLRDFKNNWRLGTHFIWSNKLNL